MNNKIIDKSVLSSWILSEVLLNYQLTSNYRVLKGFRVLKILKFLKLNKINDANFEILCILSDSNNTILCKISNKSISEFERTNKSRITEDTTNTIIMVKDIKLRWLSRIQFLNNFNNHFDNNELNDINTFAIFEIDDEIKIFDFDSDKINIGLKSIYFTNDYFLKVKPIEYELHEEFEI